MIFQTGANREGVCYLVLPMKPSSKPDDLFSKSPAHVQRVWKEAKKLKRQKQRAEWRDKQKRNERDDRAQF
jgi:hypothetical protein